MKRQLALNDFVISRSHVPRLIELEVRVDGVELTRYRCDGLIISSPTGSTAYSLAAGGAVVAPNAEVIALTPLSPHTLSIRPVIVSLSSTVQVRVISSRVESLLSADGQVQTQLANVAMSSPCDAAGVQCGWPGSPAVPFSAPCAINSDGAVPRFDAEAKALLSRKNHDPTQRHRRARGGFHHDRFESAAGRARYQ
jgi:hypothetical protein